MTVNERATVEDFRLGLMLAVGSAFAFGSSGPFAKALMEAGWSPTAAVVARLAGGALVMAVFATIVRPGWVGEALDPPRFGLGRSFLGCRRERIRRRGIGNDLCLGVHQKPSLGESLVTIPEDGRDPSFHAKESWKHRELVSPGRHYHSTSRLPEYRLCSHKIEETEILMPRQVRILLLDISSI